VNAQLTLERLAPEILLRLSVGSPLSISNVPAKESWALVNMNAPNAKNFRFFIDDLDVEIFPRNNDDLGYVAESVPCIIFSFAI